MGEQRISRRALLRGAAAAGVAVTAGTVVATSGSGELTPAAALDPPSPGASFGPVWPDGRLRETRVLWRADTDRHMVALTFDDGPMPEYTTGVITTLSRLGVRATFNLVGARVLRHPDIVAREIAGRHEIGSHTMTHADLARLSAARVRDELQRAHEVITRVAGVAPTTLRPPYGHISGETMLAAAELGYDVISWAVKFHEDLYDAAGNADYIVANLAPGSVILAHDTGNRSRLKDLDALPRLVAGARANGYEFVTVSELLAASRSSTDRRAAQTAGRPTPG